MREQWLVMRRALAITLIVASLLQSGIAVAVAPAVSRRDGFLRIWTSIRRPTEGTREVPYADVLEGQRGFAEITYAKSRGILDDDQEAFRPDDQLLLDDALIWLFRTRSIGKPDALSADTLSEVLERYPIARWPEGRGQELAEDDLLALMRNLDRLLAEEEHEVSLYGEKFHGKGTASGEPFDMYALTAAHKFFPFNTLVRVTNVDSGKSVVVRINDRGPYVEGRDMDLSVAAFTAISPREKGVIHAKFQRLGDANLVGSCEMVAPTQNRIAKDVRLGSGVPHWMALGTALTLQGPQPFVVRSVRYPDGNDAQVLDWVLPGEVFRFVPAVVGEYTFLVGTKEGRRREMTTKVVKCGD